MSSILIETPDGKGEINKIYLSELGFLMLKIYYPSGIFKTYNLGVHDENINIFTNKILEHEKYQNKNND
jgi:hypothetical protein